MRVVSGALSYRRGKSSSARVLHGLGVESAALAVLLAFMVWACMQALCVCSSYHH